MSSHAVDIDMLWFDLDDTLWDMTGNSIVCLREIYDDRNLARFFDSPGQWDEIYHSINASLWERYSRGEISQDFLRLERFAAPLRLMGVNASDAENLSRILDPLYLSCLGSKPDLIDGASEILSYLSARGYRMGIVTNGFREVQYNKLRSSAIDAFFDAVILSDDAGINKPAPEFFRFAETKASTAGGRNLIVGDNALTDVEGALNVGWDAIWFNPHGDSHTFNHSDSKGTLIATIDSLYSLKKIL